MRRSRMSRTSSWVRSNRAEKFFNDCMTIMDEKENSTLDEVCHINMTDWRAGLSYSILRKFFSFLGLRFFYCST